MFVRESQKYTGNGENNTMFRKNFLLFASFAKTITFAKHKDRENLILRSSLNFRETRKNLCEFRVPRIS
jgi:hypothetical protein